jgi:hypothetical protein
MNSFIDERGVGEEDWMDFLGLPTKGEVKNISVFKSFLNRKLYLFIFLVGDVKRAFTESSWNCCKII